MLLGWGWEATLVGIWRWSYSLVACGFWSVLSRRERRREMGKAPGKRSTVRVTKEGKKKTRSGKERPPSPHTGGKIKSLLRKDPQLKGKQLRVVQSTMKGKPKRLGTGSSADSLSLCATSEEPELVSPTLSFASEHEQRECPKEDLPLPLQGRNSNEAELSAQIFLKLAEDLKESLAGNIRSLVHDEVQRNLSGHRSSGTVGHSYQVPTGSSLFGLQRSSIRSSPLSFQNIEQFVADARQYITAELTGGNFVSSALPQYHSTHVHRNQARHIPAQSRPTHREPRANVRAGHSASAPRHSAETEHVHPWDPETMNYLEHRRPSPESTLENGDMGRHDHHHNQDTTPLRPHFTHARDAGHAVHKPISKEQGHSHKSPHLKKENLAKRSSTNAHHADLNWEDNILHVLRMAIEKKRALFGHTIKDTKMLFEEMDSDKSGFLSQGEIKRGLQRLDIGITAEKCHELMEYVHFEENHTTLGISYEEFAKALHGHRPFEQKQPRPTVAVALSSSPAKATKQIETVRPKPGIEIATDTELDEKEDRLKEKMERLKQATAKRVHRSRQKKGEQAEAEVATTRAHVQIDGRPEAARKRHWKQQGRWSSMLSAALSLDDDVDVLTGLSFEKKDRNTGPPKPATRMGNAVLVPAAPYAPPRHPWSKRETLDTVQALREEALKPKILKVGAENENPLMNVRPSLCEPKAKDILLSRCLKKLGVEEVEEQDEPLDMRTKEKEVGQNINLPFSRRIVDLILAHCSADTIEGTSESDKELEGASGALSLLDQISAIYLQLEVDSQCIPVGRPGKIKWFDVLLDTAKKKEKEESKKAGSKKKVTKGTTVARRSSVALKTRRSSETMIGRRNSGKPTTSKTTTKKKKLPSDATNIGPVLVPYDAYGKCCFPQIRKTILRSMTQKKADPKYYLRFQLGFVPSFLEQVRTEMSLA